MGAKAWVGLFVVLIGIALIAWGWISRSKEQRKAALVERWPRAPGKIESSGVRTVGFGRSTRFRPDVEFSYYAGGRRYLGRSLRPGHCDVSTEGAARRMLRRYSPGAAVQVFCDPMKPDEAYLETSISKMWAFVLGLGGVFVLVGIAMTTAALSGATGRL